MTLFQCFDKSVACPVSANASISEREPDHCVEATAALTDDRGEEPADVIIVPGKWNSYISK